MPEAATAKPTAGFPVLTISPMVRRGLYLALLLAFAGAIPKFADTQWGAARPLIDFDALYLVGTMVNSGTADQAYFLEKLFAAQQLLTGKNSFMPWTYPPPFNLVVGALATMPRWLAYTLFMATSLGAYLLVMRRLSGPQFPLAVLLTFPAIAITLSCGQNGMMSGALLGLTAILVLARRDGAGVPLGIMIIKPHIAVLFGFYLLLTRRWYAIAIAAATAFLLCAMATVSLGIKIWPAFMNGVREASEFLVQGYYPLHRMISVYAATRSAGASATLAMSAQMITALAAIGMIIAALRLRFPPRPMLGLAALASLCLSPYAYDYDLPVYGIGIALLLPALFTHATRTEAWILLAGNGVMQVWGYAGNLMFSLLRKDSIVESILDGDRFWTPSGFILVGMTALVFHILRRAGQQQYAVSDKMDGH
ncbi:MAG: glycosyltransferase family 87 protein [Beijerinckiaceae bacterium]